LGAPLGVVCQYAVTIVVYLPLSQLFDDIGNKVEAPARDLGAQAGSDIGYLVLGVLVVVGAPVVEELFYRGLLLRSLERRLGSRWAIVVSAAVFGLAHFEPVLFPALFLFGIVLGTLAVRNGRLGPGVFAHAGFNLVTMIALYASR
jgi:hypothetical protein